MLSILPRQRHHNVSALVDDGMVAGADQGGRIRLFNDGRTDELGSRREAGPPQDTGVMRMLGIVEYDCAAACRLALRRLPGLRKPARDGIPGARHRNDKTQIDDFDLFLRRRMPMTRLVLLVETAARGRCVGSELLGAGNWNGDGVLLAAIAQIGCEGETAAREMLCA